jgi:hypothetical protein
MIYIANDELERICKVDVVAQQKCYRSIYFLKGLNKTMDNISKDSWPRFEPSACSPMLLSLKFNVKFFKIPTSGYGLTDNPSKLIRSAVDGRVFPFNTFSRNFCFGKGRDCNID